MLTFEFDLILGLLLAFCGHNWRFWGVGEASKIVLRSPHVVENLSFSMFPSILTFYFDLILGQFLTFLGPNGVFFGVGVGFDTYFGVYSCS